MMPSLGKISIHRCSACGKDHENILLHTTVTERWCICPDTGKKIFVGEAAEKSTIVTIGTDWSNPIRFQLKRTRGWRKPENSISVARPTMWGNPFVVHGPYPGLFRVYSSNRLDVGAIYETVTKKEAHQKAVELFSAYFSFTIAEPGSWLYEFRQIHGWYGFQLASVCRNLLHGKNLGNHILGSPGFFPFPVPLFGWFLDILCRDFDKSLHEIVKFVIGV